MICVPTYTATIFCGLIEGYSDKIHSFDEALEIVKMFVASAQICVTTQPVVFYHPYAITGEPGIAVGLINYPRFTQSPEYIKSQALILAGELRVQLGQHRVSVVCTDETIMIGEP